MVGDPARQVRRWRAERARHERMATRAYSHYLRQRRRALRWTLAGFAAVVALVAWFWHWYGRRVERQPVWEDKLVLAQPDRAAADAAPQAAAPAVPPADPERRQEAAAAGAVPDPQAEPQPSSLAAGVTQPARLAADLGQIGRALPFVRRGREAEAGGDPRAAIEQYRIALDIWPEATDLQADLGRLYLGLGDAAAAVPFLEQALAAAPADRERYALLGQALAATGDWPRCQQLYTVAAALADGAGAWAEYQLALVAIHRTDYPRAAGHLRRFLAQPLPELELDARRRMALLSMLDEDWDDAEAQLRAALALPGGQEDGEICLGLAACRAARGDTPGTLEWLRRGEKLWQPDRAEWWLAQAFFDGVRETRPFVEWRAAAPAGDPAP